MGDEGWGPSTRPSLLMRLRNSKDQKSWRTFVEIYGPLVYRHCRNRGLQDADAAEVVQDVMVQVNLAIPDFCYDPQQGRFRGWLGTITHNRLCSFWRQRAARLRSLGSPLEAEALDGFAALPRDTTWDEAYREHILEIAVSRVRPHFEATTWRAFELLWFDGQSAAAVADEVQRPLDWVYVAKSRVLKRLKTEVSALGDEIGQLD